MANKEKLTPADYDRWGRTCVRFYEDTPPPATKGQPNKPGAATAEPKPPKLQATKQAAQNARKHN